MGELQEIRRFWPHAGQWYLFGEIYVPKPTRRHMLDATQSSDGSWYVTRYEGGCTRMTHFDGPTIAAAMAAAGFAERKPDKYARQRDQLSRWVAECQRGEGDFFSMTAPQSSQRPRKGVRLGKHGRRLALAASIGEALDATKHWRGKRKHKEVPC